MQTGEHGAPADFFMRTFRLGQLNANQSNQGNCSYSQSDAVNAGWTVKRDPVPLAKGVAIKTTHAQKKAHHRSRTATSVTGTPE